MALVIARRFHFETIPASRISEVHRSVRIISSVWIGELLKQILIRELLKQILIRDWVVLIRD